MLKFYLFRQLSQQWYTAIDVKGFVSFFHIAEIYDSKLLNQSVESKCSEDELFEICMTNPQIVRISDIGTYYKLSPECRLAMGNP